MDAISYYVDLYKSKLQKLPIVKLIRKRLNFGRIASDQIFLHNGSDSYLLPSSVGSK